jgi:hypothetical protein
MSPSRPHGSFRGNALATASLTLLVLATAFVSGCGLGWGDRTGDGNGAFGIVEVGDAAFGKPYSDWTAAWWNWAALAPSSGNPVTDTTGAFASVGQSGPVWFLAGTFGGSVTRTITIPPGVGLFFPILNSVFWAPEDAGTVPALRALAAAVPDAADVLIVEIDGYQVFNPFGFRVASPAFALDIPIGSIFTEPAFGGFAPGVRNPAVADGFWILMQPLSPGQHTIYIRGRAGPGGFETEVTYNITVQ